MSTATELVPRSIRIVVISSYSLLSEAICALLTRLPGIEVAGRASNLATLHVDASDSASEPGPGLSLAFLLFPQTAELEQLRDLRAIYPSLPVLCLALHAEPAQVLAALQAGGNDRLPLLRHERRGSGCGAPPSFHGRNNPVHQCGQADYRSPRAGCG